MILKTLDELGYKRLSVCHWAKTNRERSMYNTLAKSGADVIPFGSGAGGFVGDISMFLNRDLQRYMKEAVSVSHDSPVLLDRFLDDAIEVDIDAICDGDAVIICGIMEHIEQAGIHSGDSALPSAS